MEDHFISLHTDHAGLDEVGRSSDQKGFVLWGVEGRRKISEMQSVRKRGSHGEENRLKNNDWDLSCQLCGVENKNGSL